MPISEIVQIYRCAECKEPWPSEEEATACEASHRIPLHVDGDEYGFAVYPDRVIVCIRERGVRKSKVYLPA